MTSIRHDTQTTSLQSYSNNKTIYKFIFNQTPITQTKSPRVWNRLKKGLSPPKQMNPIERYYIIVTQSCQSIPAMQLNCLINLTITMTQSTITTSHPIQFCLECFETTPMLFANCSNLHNNPLVPYK